jgi:hypothetical protein
MESKNVGIIEVESTIVLTRVWEEWGKEDTGMN